MKHTRRYAVMLFGLLLVLVGVAAQRDLALRNTTRSVEAGARTLRTEDGATETDNGSLLSPVPSARVATLSAATGPGKAKDETKSPKGKEPLPPADPPTDPPVAPEEPPVVPEPENPPAPPAAPGAVSEAACVSADMADIITFVPPAAGEVTTYSLLRSATSDGEYSLVTTAGPDARSFVVAVSATGSWWYRVGVSGPGGEGPVSAAASNARVLMSAEVAPEGRTLRASNGEIVLTLAPGSYATTTTVTVTEVSGSPTGGLISLAGVYEITPSGALGAPATVKIAYTLPVEHFQVAQTLISAAGLMTYDEASGKWISGSGSLTAEGGYLSGTLSHFSYWALATIQPHGTSTTTYCSSGGICHDLSTYPGSATRIAARSSEVCYNCHGNDAPTKTAAGAGADARNIQAEFFQIPAFPAPAGASWHPVATGGLYCTACHDPHADPQASPGLLKSWNPLTGTYISGGGGFSPGSDFCWTCHGAVKNRRVEYLHPGYYVDSGGDKMTGFNGAHTASRTTTTRYDTADELRQGSTLGAQILAGGTVEDTFEQVKLPKDPVAVAAPPFQNGAALADKVYDGDTSDTGGAVWYAGINLGASAATSWVGTGTVTIDLGRMTEVRSFECVGLAAADRSAHVLEIRTSDTGAANSFVKLASQGQLGTPLPFTTTLNASTRCRYVQFVFSRQFAAAGDRLDILELSIYGYTPGTFTIRPDLARRAAYGSGQVKWGATGPAASEVTVDARLSTNNGVSWSVWQPVTNGGPLLQSMAGANLEYAQMELRTTLAGTPGAAAALDWIEVSTTRGNITGAAPVWTGGSQANECQRCHTSHGSQNPGLVLTGSTAVCTTCHAGAYGSYTGAGDATTGFSASVHKTVACAQCHTSHGNASGSGARYAFLLRNTPRDACLGCHTTVKAAFDAGQGPALEWAKHDIYSPEQGKTGSRIACRNCHGTHYSATGLVNPDDPTQAYTATRTDPTTIPTTQVVIYASRDTMLDSASPSVNYGQSTQGTITPSTRALFYFDLSTIPASATIQNAVLDLTVSDSAQVSVDDHFVVYPITASWSEAAATWLKRESALSWTVPGGDLGAIGPVGTHGFGPRNITDIVRAQHLGPNNGIALTAHDLDTLTSLPVYMDEYSGANSATYRPRLRVVYQTGPATGTVLNDQTFCLKCHDTDMPFNLKKQEGLLYVNTSYDMYNEHGALKGIGSDTVSLKSPYSWGMDGLPCTTCHDPHGSRLPFHLKEVVNGRDMTPVFSGGWDYTTTSRRKVSAWFCGACHIYAGGYHAGYEGSTTEVCEPCHHGGH